MAGFTDFLKNNGGLLSSIVGLVPALFSKSYRYKLTGAHLTGAEKEANAFTAQQAQNQMAFQQQMRDTQYQSAVADMKNAGINPALMYGSGASGNVAPTGAMASSVTPTSGQDPMGMVSMIANLSLLNAQKENIKADTKVKTAEAKKSESETILNDLKAKYQNILNEWYPKLSKNTIDSMQASIAEMYSNVSLNDYRADNMQADTALKRTQEFVQSLEAQWLPRLKKAQEQGYIASAAQAFAEASYKKYFKKYAEEHDGQLPGYNQALGIGSAVAGALSDLGVGEVDLGDLDWKDMLWPWFSPFRKKNQK